MSEKKRKSNPRLQGFTGESRSESGENRSRDARPSGGRGGSRNQPGGRAGGRRRSDDDQGARPPKRSGGNSFERRTPRSGEDNFERRSEGRSSGNFERRSPRSGEGSFDRKSEGRSSGSFERRSPRSGEGNFDRRSESRSFGSADRGFERSDRAQGGKRDGGGQRSERPSNRFGSRDGDRRESGKSFGNRENRMTTRGDNEGGKLGKNARKKQERRESGFSDKRTSGRTSTGSQGRYDSFARRKKRIIETKPDDGTIRLNKYVANAGISSRREADEFIRTGLVEVNGKVITEMGFKVKQGDEVRFDGKRISPEKPVYVLLNKPKGYITTTKDERDRKTVMDLVANATSARLFPVGRLDRQTTGVLLFTNDGHMAKKLMHPSHEVRKIYHVILDKNLHGDDMGRIREGIEMMEGVAKVDKINFIDGKAHNEVGVEIHIGWNRVVRRIFEKLGYKIEYLDRVSFAGLTKKTLKRGDWRILSEDEVNYLKMV